MLIIDIFLSIVLSYSSHTIVIQ